MPSLFHENEFVFNVLFEAVSEGVVVVDESQTIVATNVAAEQMFGYTKGELITQHLNILIPPNYHVAHSAHGGHYDTFYKQSSARKMGENKDLFGAHKNGTKIPVEVGLNPFKISKKNMYYL